MKNILKILVNIVSTIMIIVVSPFKFLDYLFERIRYSEWTYGFCGIFAIIMICKAMAGKTISGATIGLAILLLLIITGALLSVIQIFCSMTEYVFYPFVITYNYFIGKSFFNKKNSSIYTTNKEKKYLLDYLIKKNKKPKLYTFLKESN